MESRKIGSNGNADMEKQTCGHSDGMRRWDELGEQHGNIHIAAVAKLLRSYLTLCDPIDGLLPGSSVPGIFQARILEWVAISFSRRSS